VHFYHQTFLISCDLCIYIFIWIQRSCSNRKESPFDEPISFFIFKIFIAFYHSLYS